MRDERSATGPLVGFTTVEDSYLVTSKGVGVWVLASVNGASELSPQTTVLRNVQFDYPKVDLSGQEFSHIYIHDTSDVTSYTNQSLRNDVRIYNYNGVKGDGDLYRSRLSGPQSL